MRITAALFGVVFMAACRGDESVAAYGGGARDWQLVELDGAPFKARATLRFGPDGEISGEAPCNRFFGKQTAPYPWFAVDNIGATRRACPELDQETAYLTALTEMTLSEVAGDTLLLSNDAGREMLFRAPN